MPSSPQASSETPSTHRPAGHQPPRARRAALAPLHLAPSPFCHPSAHAPKPLMSFGVTWVMWVSRDERQARQSILICLVHAHISEFLVSREQTSYLVQALTGQMKWVSLELCLSSSPRSGLTAPVPGSPCVCVAVARSRMDTQARDAGRAVRFAATGP